MTVTLVLLIHTSMVHTSIFSLFTRLNPMTLIKNLRPAMLFAFSTCERHHAGNLECDGEAGWRG